MGENGKLIEATDGQKIIGQVVISLIEVRPGATVTNFQTNIADELLCRGLMDKGKAAMEQHFAQQNAPRVVPGTGAPLPRFRP